MTNYFELSSARQQTIIIQTSTQLGIPPQAIEKDLWVTTILQIVFTLPISKHLVFKGGTSLSKVYGLINRFSEDIDLAIDRVQFGLDGDLTKKQIKKLRKESSLFVKNEFAEELRRNIKNYGLNNRCQVIPEPDGEGDETYPEPRKIHIVYDSLFQKNSYLESEVILEIGARSLFEPTKPAEVESLVSNQFEQINTSVVSPLITTAVPEKTFLEKAFLLHELFSTERGYQAKRKSRHLYDLERMMDLPFAKDAIKDDALWNTISHHREIFTSMSGVDYTPDIRRRIQLIPPSSMLKNWEKDYRDMQVSMIYGASISFDSLLGRMKELEDRFHA